MNSLTRTLLWVITIILFTLGIWPIALILMIVLIISASRQRGKELEETKQENERLKQELHEKENQELKEEVQKLRAELQAQAVRHAMDKAEKRD